MVISQKEFRSDFEKYMNMARRTDIYITDESKHTAWILTHTNDNRWFESILPLIHTILQRARRPAVSGG